MPISFYLVNWDEEELPSLPFWWILLSNLTQELDLNDDNSH